MRRVPRITILSHSLQVLVGRSNNANVDSRCARAADCLELKLSFRALSEFETFCQLQDYAWPDGFSRTTRSVSLTFDPAVHQRTIPGVKPNQQRSGHGAGSCRPQATMPSSARYDLVTRSI